MESVNESYFEKKYLVTWESSVLGRKGCIPVTVEPILKPPITAKFKDWTKNGSFHSCVVNLKREQTETEDTLKLHVMGDKPSSKAWLQGKSVILFPVGQESLEIPTSVLLFGQDSYQLLVEWEQGKVSGSVGLGAGPEKTFNSSDSTQIILPSDQRPQEAKQTSDSYLFRSPYLITSP